MVFTHNWCISNSQRLWSNFLVGTRTVRDHDAQKPKQRAKSSCPTSTASNAVSLFRSPWHLTQFSNESPVARAKIKPTHVKLRRLSQSTLQDCKHCTMTAVIWEDCSGQIMCKQSLSEGYGAQMHTPCYRRRWSHYLQQHLRSNSVHIIPWYTETTIWVFFPSPSALFSSQPVGLKTFPPLWFSQMECRVCSLVSLDARCAPKTGST